MEEVGVSMTTGFPEISVVIPVKNEALKIRACIEGIMTQTIPVKEIIVIDSGSVDGTIDILKEYNLVKLIQIPSSEFNHGLTRNRAAREASGEFVLLTVGDARPFDNLWIEELLKGFVDESVAGVCGQQVIPHERDKNPIEWYRPVSTPVISRYEFTLEEFELLSASEKKTVCAWDDVTAMYRRSILMQIPFQKTSYCEDAIWAKEAVMKGYAIVYNPAARVYHYHLEDADFTFKRSFTTMYFRYKQFGYLYPLPFLSLRHRLSMIKTLVKSLGTDVKGIIKWYNYNTSNFKAFARSYSLFTELLEKGETVLDKKHEDLCGKPPIPLKVK